MEWILYLSIALIAIAITILVIYLAKTLKALQATLVNVAKTVESLEKQLDGLTSESTELLHKTNRLAEDVQKKSEALHTVFEGIEGIGNTIKETNESFRDIRDKIAGGVVRQSENVSQAIQWGNAALEIWEKYKFKKDRLPK